MNQEPQNSVQRGYFMRKLVLILIATAALSAFAADTTVKGHLVDMACAREDGQKAGFGASHTKDCLQMAECVQSGYGVLTDDKKIIMFDAAGNEQAKKFIAALSKTSDIKVTVTGARSGDTMSVSKIELQ
jgi:hypothetical protein